MGTHWEKARKTFRCHIKSQDTFPQVTTQFCLEHNWFCQDIDINKEELENFLISVPFNLPLSRLTLWLMAVVFRSNYKLIWISFKVFNVPNIHHLNVALPETCCDGRSLSKANEGCSFAKIWILRSRVSTFVFCWKHRWIHQPFPSYPVSRVSLQWVWCLF